MSVFAEYAHAETEQEREELRSAMLWECRRDEYYDKLYENKRYENEDEEDEEG